MTVSNDEIIQRIKENRKKAGKTQQEMANYLGKTAAAISDLERGKVQVSATDLSKIADFLEIPVNNLFNNLFENESIRNFIDLLQKISRDKGKQEKYLSMIKLMVDLQILLDRTEGDPGKELSPEEIGEFFTKVVNLSARFKMNFVNLDIITEKLFRALKERGIKPPERVNIAPEDALDAKAS